MSAALLPGWDNPAVEPGIILANIGEFEEAFCELERAKENLCEATPHLLFTMGYVLMNLSRYAEALEQLEEVVAARPDHALAFLYAARCAFRLRDKTKGVRYAKTARRLGESGEYIAWKEGRYSSRSPRGAHKPVGRASRRLPPSLMRTGEGSTVGLVVAG